METSMVVAVEMGGGCGGRWGWEVGEREKSEVGKKKKRGESMWEPHIFVCVFEDE